MPNLETKPLSRDHSIAILLLISVSFLLPIAWLSHRLAQEENAQIASAQSAVLDAKHSAALRAVLFELLQHRDLPQLSALGAPSGQATPSTPTPITPITPLTPLAALDHAMAQVDLLDQRHGAQWDSHEDWLLIRARWDALRSRLATLDQVSRQAQHDALTQALLEQIARVAEHANAALDSRLDIHSISHLLTVALPALAVDLIDLRQQGVHLISTGQPTPAQATAIATLAQEAGQKLQDMQRSMATAFSYNAALKHDLTPLFATTTNSLRSTVQSVASSFETDQAPPFTALQWHEQLTQSAQELHTLGQVLADTRKELIESRLTSLQDTQWLTQTLTAGLVLLAVMVTALLGARLFASTRARERALRARAQALAERARAEQASAAKSDFLAAMSHEIRTPLNAMIGFSDLLASSALNAEQSTWAQQVVDNADSLARLVDDILDMSKIEAGKLSIENVAASPRAIVEQCANSYRVLAQKKGLDFELEIHALPEVVLLDPIRLRQIVLNFLSNALKFTPSGQIKLRASADHGRLRFEIRDTGIGMSAERRDHIFNTAYQTDAATTREFGGTGLGLQICAQLATLMHGQVGVESAPGVGSLFWLELPETVAEVDSQPVLIGDAGKHRPHGTHGPVNGKPLHTSGTVHHLHPQPHITRFDPPLEILVADDVAGNRLLVSSIAASLGCRVRTACDGAEAVREALDRPFELILLDLHMPKLSGIDAAKQIRASGPNRETAILALTASAYAADAARCTEAGMNDHVAKPVRAAALRDTIAQWGALARGHAFTSPAHAAPLSHHLATARTPATTTSTSTSTLSAMPTTLSATLIDETLFAEQTEGLSADTVAALLASLNERMSAVDVAISADVTEDMRAQLQWTVHQLVSSAGMLGAMPLSDAAALLDSALADQMPLDQVRSLAADLLTTLRATARALAQRPAPPA